MLAVGVLLFMGGMLAVFNPREMMLEHPMYGKNGVPSPSRGPEMLSANTALIYGLATAAVGIFIVRISVVKRSE